MRVVLVGLLLFAAAACSGGGTRATSTPAGATSGPVTTAAPGELPSAEELCGLLPPAEWTQAGLANAESPAISTDGPGTAYCTYAGTSGASGGLEFDAFVHENDADAEATLETITGEGPEMTPVDLLGADTALITSSESDYAAIAVRIGRFTFTIAIPASESAEDQLTTLANRVIDQSAFYR